MTVLKGKDLIIMADGVALAAAKSCDIEVNCDVIPVSSPTSGEWEDSIPGRKSWKVTTNHLVMSAASMLLKVSKIVTLRMENSHRIASLGTMTLRKMCILGKSFKSIHFLA